MAEFIVAIDHITYYAVQAEDEVTAIDLVLEGQGLEISSETRDASISDYQIEILAPRADRLADSDQEQFFDRQPMIDALRFFLSHKGRHFHFLTVSELLSRGRPQKKIWYKEPNVELLNTLRSAGKTTHKYVQQSHNKWLARVVHTFLDVQN